MNFFIIDNTSSNNYYYNEPLMFKGRLLAAQFYTQEIRVLSPVVSLLYPTWPFLKIQLNLI